MFVDLNLILHKTFDMFDWLKRLFVTGPPEGKWYMSSNGNPTYVRAGWRITIFEDDLYGGWKWCLANGDDDNNPQFSNKRYANTEDAAEAAVNKLLAITGL